MISGAHDVCTTYLSDLGVREGFLVGGDFILNLLNGLISNVVVYFHIRLELSFVYEVQHLTLDLLWRIEEGGAEQFVCAPVIWSILLSLEV